MLEKLKERLKEVEHALTAAYANLNLYTGMKHEVERLIAELMENEAEKIKEASEQQASDVKLDTQSE